VELAVWTYTTDEWVKLPKLNKLIEVSIEDSVVRNYSFGKESLADELAKACSLDGLSCELRVEVALNSEDMEELTVLLVNTSPKTHTNLRDTNLYECAIEMKGLEVAPFILESLPDSFRYDRRIPAYGINSGVEVIDSTTLRTTDTVCVDTERPSYWNVPEAEPHLSFEALSTDPIPQLNQLIDSHAKWGQHAWGYSSIKQRASDDNWSEEMLSEASGAAEEFFNESKRMKNGLELLGSDQSLLKAFKLMNSAMSHAANGRYDSWRPFQIGFLLSNLESIANNVSDADVVDIVWFATGGGKTETYLGLLITAAIYERIGGKHSGITAWSRFPLRMLSLQQTQRFADAMAGAEIVRRQASIEGDPFSVGFFVGQSSTPNSLKEEAAHGELYDVEDDQMPDRCRVLLYCPFCHRETVSMDFNRRFWKLEHQCTNSDCPWPEAGLPFYVVDDEIYRFLPTVIVGTLDKAASIGMQAGMRGFVGAPLGICSVPGHGFTYAPRASRPNGCLVPGCAGKRETLRVDEKLFAPSFRLQDELHLLRDSLGAVDSHYESLFDALENELSARQPKILASSATLTGYDRQSRLLYQRSARIFPVPGPSTNEGFWTSSTNDMARRYVAVAPRGVTIEYAVDRTITELQTVIRSLENDPQRICHEAGIDPTYVDDIVSLYGVNVVYGSTLRDLDAVSRSLETQIDVEGPLNTASLTGKTNFEDVRITLERLQKPEKDFDKRLHVVTASSMMSHGVDVDRLNLMVMLGIPLTAAEFIQATARIGRSWPGSVYVMQKMARERDASVFRCFEKFVRHADRFVEPIPITRRSRRVLEKTTPGIFLARILAIHEPDSAESLATTSKLRAYFSRASVSEKQEFESLVRTLGFEGAFDVLLRKDLEMWVERFFGNLNYPTGDFKFPSQLSPTGRPMRSLRDVEEEVPIFGL